MIGKVKAAWRWMKLGKTLNKGARTIRKENERMGFKAKKAWTKAGVGFLAGAGSLALGAILGYASDPIAMTAVLESADISPEAIGILVGIVTGGARLAHNWWKHRDNPGPPNGVERRR